MYAAPFVDPRWGSSDEDIAELVHCVKTMRQVMANTDNPNYSGTELEPSASAKTDQQITQFVRNNIWGMHPPSPPLVLLSLSLSISIPPSSFSSSLQPYTRASDASGSRLLFRCAHLLLPSHSFLRRMTHLAT